MPAATTASQRIIETEQCLVLSRIDWGQYETISSALANRAGLRMIYCDGSLTLLSATRRRGA
jgi:hypothetical protein